MVLFSVNQDGKEYTWDGQAYKDKNKARTVARKYLRWGFDVVVKANEGIYYVYKYRPHWRRYFEER